MRKLELAAAVVAALTVGRAAGNVEVDPPALGRVPVTGLGGGQYWQQLRITLQVAHEPSDSLVTIDLPAGTMLPDTDTDGQVTDEIRVVYARVGDEDAVCRAGPGSSATTIVVASAARAEAGSRLYLQFPLGMSASPAGPTLTYGPVAFAQPEEPDLAQGPSLYLVTDQEFAALHSMGVLQFGPVLADAADTLTAAAGSYYPEEAVVLVDTAPDLVFDGGPGTTSNLIPAGSTGIGDGRDDNDTIYRFVWAMEPNLTRLSSARVWEAAVEVAGEEVTLRATEGGAAAFRLLTWELPAGTYYLYALSSLTGDLPLARSRALVVRHEPEVLYVGPQSADIVLDSGGLLDPTGQATLAGVSRTVIPFAVRDHDDLARVYLFYAAEARLGPGDLQLGEDGVGNLGAAVPMAAPGALTAADSVFTWDVAAPEPVTAGDYYVYAVASDGTSHAVGRSAYRIRVRHSPFLELDALDDGVLTGADTIVTGGVRPQRYVTFTWGRSLADGDSDPDDDARISLYYSPEPALSSTLTSGWSLPGGAPELLASLGDRAFAIATGIPEDPDGRLADQYVWDLWQAGDPGQVPMAGVVHYVYGLIEDGASQRLVQLNGGRPNDAASRLVFLHPPALRVLQPTALTVLRPGSVGRVAWEDQDLDDDARLRVVLTPLDHGPLSTYAEVASPEARVVSRPDDAVVPPAVDALDLSEDSPADYLDIRSAELSLGAGSYYVYVAITDAGRFDAGALAWRAPGTVQVEPGEAAPVAAPIALVPDVFTVGNLGGRQRLEVRVSDGGQAVDLVSVALRLDPGLFDVADQDTLTAGVQPFAAGPAFWAASLVTNRVEPQTDGGLLLVTEYFAPTAARIAGLDGRAALATVELLALGPEGPAQVHLAADAEGAGLSHLDRDGVALLRPTPGPLASGTLVNGRATLSGVVSLEGRGDMSTLVDVALRPWARYVDWQDTVFAAVNDADPGRDGVQVPVSAEGAFEVRAVPPERLDLRLHHDGYLDAWVSGLDLHPAQIVEDLQPSTPGGTRPGWMLGGDVAGSVEGGVVGPDNEVTLADWDYVAAHFGLPADTEERRRADITGDGLVQIEDLSLVGANYLQRGPAPVYRPAARGPVQVTLERQRPSGGAADEIVLALRAQGLVGVRAFQATLAGTTDEWAVVEAAVGGEGTLTARRTTPAGWMVAGVLPGRQRDFGPQAELARWYLCRLRPAAREPRLGPVVLLDRDDRPVPAGESLASRALPASLRLGAGYPNPFNGGTTIPLGVPAGAGLRRVVLEVYDLLGQRLAVLWEGPLDAGHHRLYWDGRDVAGRPAASGVYLCRLQEAGGTAQLQRLVLVR
ncbi:MAG: hypothetical protein AB1505_18145 [Candidatus Latescibacterota bacterium]